MEFKETRGIYLQIADQICEKILQEEWSEEERIPSIREMAAEVGVNPNTVTRSYQSLLEENIIYNKRGIGYFIMEGAKEKIIEKNKDDFIQNEVPAFFKAMDLLGIQLSELEELYKQQKGA